MTSQPAQAAQISPKCLISLCLEAGSEAGKDFRSGQTAELPDFSWASAFVPFPLPLDGPMQMQLPALRKEIHFSVGVVRGEGRRPGPCHCRWGEKLERKKKKTHLRIKA